MATVLRQLSEHLRPYRSLEALGEAQFRFQVYFVTHLVFVVSGWGGRGWGARPVSRAVCAEEWLFLYANLQTCVALQDVELVGEVVHSLRLLQVPEADPVLQLGLRCLLDIEAELGCTGNFLSKQQVRTRRRDDHADPFYYQYHAAFTAILGLDPHTFMSAATEVDADDTVIPSRPPFVAGMRANGATSAHVSASAHGSASASASGPVAAAAHAPARPPSMPLPGPWQTFISAFL